MTIVQMKDANAQPVQSLVEELEHALDLARSGELRTIAMVGDMTGNRTFTSFDTSDMQSLIGRLSFLHHTLCARQRESVE